MIRKVPINIFVFIGPLATKCVEKYYPFRLYSDLIQSGVIVDDQLKADAGKVVLTCIRFPTFDSMMTT